MMTDAEKILDELQTLEGKTLGERYKIINKLTQLAKTLNIGTDILNLFSPRDYFEKKLWVQILNSTKNNDIFMRALKSEDNELIDILFQNSEWFFRTHKLNAAELVKDIIATISLSNRRKLLRCLTKYLNETEIEEHFSMLRAHYGLNCALVLLPACSTTFIESVLKEEFMIVSEKLLEKIYFNKPQAAINYLKYIEANKDLCKTINDHKLLIKKIAFDRPEEFFELYNYSYAIQLDTLGVNTTKKLIATGKSIILRAPKKYVSILHNREIHASLNYTEFKQFYEALCPTDEEEFSREFSQKKHVHSLLRYVKKNKLQFLLSAYRSVYGTNLIDNKSLITDTLMDILDTELRIECARYMINHKDQHLYQWERWYCYLPPNEAIPKLKECVYITTDPAERCRFIEYMFKCCGINNDLEALNTSMQYVLERHRNEDIRFWQRVWTTIEKHFKLKDFNVNIWNRLDELFKLINLEMEWQDISGNASLAILLIERIRYSLDNGQDIQELMEYYIKLKNWSYRSEWNILQDKENDYEKRCITCVGYTMPKIDNYEIGRDFRTLQVAISDYNKRRPDNKLTILLFDWAKEQIYKIFAEKATYEINTLQDRLENDPEAKEYFSSVMPARKISIEVYNLQKFIKQPDLILEQFDSIKKEALQMYNILTFLKCIRYRKFIYIPGLRVKILKACMYEFMNAKEPSVRACALRVLSYLLDFKSFYDLTVSFYPENKTIETAKHDKILYAIQKSIACCLARYPGHAEMFDALDTFCGGDYLKLTIGSLNSICQKTNVTKTLPFLNKMLCRPVSTKKHMIRLIDLIDTNAAALKVLHRLWEKEKNPSLRNTIITCIFNRFKTNWDSQTWHLLNTIFLQLSKQDKDILYTLLNFENVKIEYRAEYIQLCWQTIERMEKNEELTLSTEKSSVLNRIKNNINILETNFLDSLILQCFHSSHKQGVQDSFSRFVVVYIVTSELTISQTRITKVMEVLKQYVKSNWCKVDLNDTFNYPARQTVFEFVRTLCKYSVDYKGKYNSMSANLSLTTLQLLDILSQTQIYKQYLLLNLTLIFLDTKQITDFVNKVKSEFIEPNINKYGPAILSKLISTIEDLITMQQPNYEGNLSMDIAEGFVKDKRSQYYDLCAIQLMTKTKETKDKYRNLVQIIESNPDETVQIYLNELINE